MLYCVLMCGGKGTRIKSVLDLKMEKPLILLKNKPLIEYLIKTLIQTNKFERIFAAVSNNTIKTQEFIKSHFQNKITLLETSGREYSEDYLNIINFFKEFRYKKNKDIKKILFLPIDIPLILPSILTQIINTNQEKPCLTIILEKEFIENLGIIPSYEFTINKKNYCYSGISVVDISQVELGNTKKNSLIDEDYIILNRSEIACNINTLKDLKIAEKFLEF
ncbi:MAG: NTP transferase domain-containing protein [Nitrosopumilus sp.]|nr:NTP transferase domain-containing protein [Nitrosopumilus sp.]